MYYDKQIEGKYSGKIKKFNSRIKRIYRDIYMSTTVQKDNSAIIEAQIELNKIFRDIYDFNNKVGYEYLYHPNLKYLMLEGIKQANEEYRLATSSVKNYHAKKKMRQAINQN